MSTRNTHSGGVKLRWKKMERVQQGLKNDIMLSFLIFRELLDIQLVQNRILTPKVLAQMQGWAKISGINISQEQGKNKFSNI
ncbi:MAG: hypothetical protein EZS28_029610 [Streblomastix strix]|uniref:Uncharacterized protein n=1 Tax=Streblomastix strix TaxID=222440 RepID=A0A5J4UX95_9EUKA|nr:MAG: hypothetical protein EZS28_029610 [Streblomastix strix]